jgi:hypothetical protein
MSSATLKPSTEAEPTEEPFLFIFGGIVARNSRLNFFSISFGAGSAGVDENVCTYDKEACLP